MLHKKTIAVVIPAFNEETQIENVIKTMPDFVDRVIVVNDCSNDGTEAVVRGLIAEQEQHALPSIKKTVGNSYDRADRVVEELNRKELDFFVPSEIVNEQPDRDRIILINQKRNSGVGAAIARGYKWCKDHHIACTAVMAGDGQMDPAELESICLPVVEEGIDYVKGNRLIHRSSWLVIPKVRYFGNSILSILTKIASGYWHVSDTQTGYTAISLDALNAIRLYKIYKS